MSYRTLCFWICAKWLLLAGCPLCSGVGNQFTVPNGFENRDGNSFSKEPLVIINPEAGGNFYGPIRLQQLFEANQFSTLPPGGAFLIAMYWRADCANRLPRGFTNSTVKLSTTPRVPDRLSAVFKENTGPDETLVVEQQKVVGFAERPCRFSQSAPFGVTAQFRLNNPFFYDPARGNLLMDLQTSGADQPTEATLGLIDAQDEVGDSVSRIAAPGQDPAVASVVDTLGLLTYFEFVPVQSLDVRFETNSVVLTWFPEPRVFKLQMSDRIDAPESWELVSQPPVLALPFNVSVSLPAETLGKTKYFRLFWNSPQPMLPPLNGEAGLPEDPEASDLPSP